MHVTPGDLISKYIYMHIWKNDVGHTSFLTLLINTYVYVRAYMCIYMCMYTKKSIHTYIASFLEAPQCHPVPLTFKTSLWSEKY